MTGDFRRAITVQTNDPNHARVVLVCKGRILDPVTLKPKSINFGQLRRTASVQHKKVVITRGDAGPLKLKLKPVATEHFQAQLKEIEAGERYELMVSFTPSFESTLARATLVLETGIAEAPTISISAYATKLPRVVAQPRRFAVPTQRKPDWQGSVRLVWDDDAPHEILSATVSDPGLKVSLSGKDGQRRIVLQVPDGYEPQPGRKIVTITTNDAEAPTVKVPIVISGKTKRTIAKRSASARGRVQKAKSGKITARTTKPKAPTSASAQIQTSE